MFPGFSAAMQVQSLAVSSATHQPRRFAAYEKTAHCQLFTARLAELHRQQVVIDNGVFLLFQYVFSKLCFSMVHIKNKFNQKPGNSNTLCVKVLLFCMIMFSIICPAQEFSPSKQDDANAEDFPVASDINVAETALKDGLTKLARERALAAFYSPDSSQLIRNRAFRVLMTICEKELTVSDFSDLIDSESFDDKPWPAGDASFHVLRLYWQGRVLALSKRFEEASEILDIVVDSPKTDPFLKTAAIRLLAYCMAVSGDELSAADVLGGVDEGQPEAVLDRARLLLNAGRAESAVGVLAPLMVETQKPEIIAVAHLLNAQALGEIDSITNAVKTLADLSTLEIPVSADHKALAMAAEAFLLAESGEISEKTIALIEGALEIAESLLVRFECEMAYARIMSKCGQAEHAAESTRRLIAMMPRSHAVAQTICDVGENLLLLNKNEEALSEFALFISSISGSPLEALAYRGRGRALVNLERYAEAVSSFFKAAELSVENDSFKIKCILNAASAQRTGKFDHEAVKTVTELLEKELPAHIRLKALLLRAESLAEFDKNSAINAFLEIAEEFPEKLEHEYSLFRAAQLMVHSTVDKLAPEQFVEAVGLYARAAETDNSELRASSLLGIGLLNFRNEDFQDALESFRAAVTITNGGEAVQRAMFMSGETLMALGRENEAIETVQELLQGYENSPWFAEAVFWMGRRAFNNQNNAEAQKYFKQFAETWPDSKKADVALLFTSYSLFYEKRYQDTIDVAMKVVSDYPEGGCADLAQYIHAEALCELLQFDKAVLIYDTILQTSGNDDLKRRAMGRRGDCYFTLGSDNAERYEESITAYEMALSDPGTILLEAILQYEYKIGRSLDKAGRIDDAFSRFYEKVILRFEESLARDNSIAETPARFWYSRAVFGAAEITSRQGNSETTVSLLQRIINGNYPGADEASRRLEGMKATNIR